MKLSYALIAGNLIYFLACSHVTSDYTLSAEVQPLKESYILFSKDSNNYLYDIQVTDSYLAVLDNERDTVLQVYTLDAQPTDMLCLRSGTSSHHLINPQFTKSDTRGQCITNQISILDKNTHL